MTSPRRFEVVPPEGPPPTLRDIAAKLNPQLAVLVFAFPWLAGVVTLQALGRWDWALWGGMVLASYLFVGMCVAIASRLSNGAAPAASAALIGAEGILVEYGSKERELVVFDRITRVKHSGREVALRVRRHGTVRLHFESDEHAASFCTTLEGRQSSASRARPPAHHVAERAGASHRAMVDELTAAASGDVSYRKEALSADDLAALVAAADVKPRYRIAAAAALKTVDAKRAASEAEAVRAGTVNAPLRDALAEVMSDQLLEAQIADAEEWHEGRSS